MTEAKAAGWGKTITQNQAVNLVLGVLLLCNVAFSEFPVTGILSLFYFALFLINVFIYNPVIFLKYLHFIFASTAGIFGCAVIEYFKIHLRELSDMSSFQGSLPLLVFSWWLFLTVLTDRDKRISNMLSSKQNPQPIEVRDFFSKETKHSEILLSLISAAGCILIVFTFAKVFTNPSFLLGLDRFDYAKEFDYGFLYDQAERFIRYLLIPCIAVAVYKNSKIGWTALIVYCLHSFWIGSKFGSFFSLLCTFAMLYSQKASERMEDLKKIIAGLMICIIALVGVAVFAVSFTRDEGASNYLLPRIAQQGQLWWKTYSKSERCHIGEFGEEIESLRKGSSEISDNAGARYGIYKIMYYTTPKTQVDAKLQGGSRYTEAGYAAAYYYLGIPGCMLFAIIGAVLTSTFVNYFLYYIRYGQYLRAFINLRLHTNMAVLMSMFIFFPYFNKTSILSYLILMLCQNKMFKYGNEQI